LAAPAKKWAWVWVAQEYLIGAPRTTQVKLAIPGVKVGDISVTARYRRDQNAILIGVKHPISVHHGDMRPHARRNSNAKDVHSIVISVPEPDLITAIIDSPIDAKQARRVCASD
jgi:hypothetical protein